MGVFIIFILIYCWPLILFLIGLFIVYCILSSRSHSHSDSDSGYYTGSRFSDYSDDDDDDFYGDNAGYGNRRTKADPYTESHILKAEDEAAFQMQKYMDPLSIDPYLLKDEDPEMYEDLYGDL